MWASIWAHNPRCRTSASDYSTTAGVPRRSRILQDPNRQTNPTTNYRYRQNSGTCQTWSVRTMGRENRQNRWPHLGTRPLKHSNGKIESHFSESPNGTIPGHNRTRWDPNQIWATGRRETSPVCMGTTVGFWQHWGSRECDDSHNEESRTTYQYFPILSGL